MHKYFQKTCHFTSISASTFCRGLSLLTHKHTLWANMLLCRPCCIWLKVLWVGLVRKGKRGKQWSARSLRDSIIMWESSWTAFIINQKWQCFSLDDRNANPCGTVWKIPFHATVVARVFVRPFLCHHADRSTFQISWWPGMQREWLGWSGLWKIMQSHCVFGAILVLPSFSEHWFWPFDLGTPVLDGETNIFSTISVD